MDAQNCNAAPEIRIMDGALLRASTACGVIVYRGFDWNAARQKMLNAEVGSVFQDHGYVSTTLYAPVAMNYIGGTCLLARIELPPGSQAMYLGAIPGPPAADSEYEFLLARGLSFMITKREIFRPPEGESDAGRAGKQVVLLHMKVVPA